jgi:hypothetical protein
MLDRAQPLRATALPRKPNITERAATESPPEFVLFRQVLRRLRRARGAEPEYGRGQRAHPARCHSFARSEMSVVPLRLALPQL